MDIRLLDWQDGEKWAALIAQCFGRDPRQTNDLWQWLHRAGEVVAWGAWDRQRLVAQYSCLVRELLLLGESRPVGMSVNMAVHPDYRGQGIIKQLAAPVYQALTEQGCVAGVGFSNADGVKVDRHSKGYGYQVVGQLLPIITFLVSRSGREQLTLTSQFPIGRWQLRPDHQFITFAQTIDWARQRYGDHPFRQYHFGVWETPNGLGGLVVYRPIWVGKIKGVSLLALYGQSVEAIFARWVNALQPLGVRFIHTLVTPAAHLRPAFRTGRLSLRLPYSRSPHYLTVKPLKDEYANVLLDYSRWDCSGGDIL